MLCSEKWLKEWVNTDEKAQVLADKLSMAGLEVESVEPVKADFTNVVIAKIEQCEKHPNADKLQICQVNDGADTLQIVCGAQNARKGLWVALAKVDAVLPGNFKIKQSKIRDVESSGMLCSQKELGLGTGHEGILELPNEAHTFLGESLEQYFEMKDDTMLEIDLTPNRGDCLSIAGVAREIAAILPSQLTMPKIPQINTSIEDRYGIKVEAAEDCPRYCCRIIKNVDLTKSLPVYIKERLRRMGVKSINPIVDLANYVMFELGQPMHAFDLNKLNGNVVVRKAQKNEALTFLDGKKATLKEDDLVISDNDGAIALAGIIGGLDSGINHQSVDILLESAYFSPDAIRGKAREYGLHTDASHRYERGVDPYLQEAALNRLTGLILEISGGKAGPIVEVKDNDHIPVKKPVLIKTENCQRSLGLEFNAEQLKDYFQRLACKVTIQSNDELTVEAPSYRFDLNYEHDFIEEVARIHGYDLIPVNIPSAKASSVKLDELDVDDYKLRSHLISFGFNEVISYSFVDEKEQGQFHPDEKAIALQNPISENMGVMRLSLITGLLMTLARNFRYQQKDMRLFEIGNEYFFNKDGQISEKSNIAAIMTGKDMASFWSNTQKIQNKFDFFAAKGVLESLIGLSINHTLDELTYQISQRSGFHPYQTADVFLNDKYIGFIGRILDDILHELDVEQDVFFFQIDLDPITQRDLPKYQEISKYPNVSRDLAFIADKSLTVQDFIQELKSFAGPYLKNVQIFDSYESKQLGESQKSIAFNLVFQNSQKTLTENEIEFYINSIINGLEDKLKVRLR